MASDMWYSSIEKNKEVQQAREALAKAKLQEKNKLENGYHYVKTNDRTFSLKSK